MSYDYETVGAMAEQIADLSTVHETRIVYGSTADITAAVRYEGDVMMAKAAIEALGYEVGTIEQIEGDAHISVYLPDH